MERIIVIHGCGLEGVGRRVKYGGEVINELNTKTMQEEAGLTSF